MSDCYRHDNCRNNAVKGRRDIPKRNKIERIAKACGIPGYPYKGKRNNPRYSKATLCNMIDEKTIDTAPAFSKPKSKRIRSGPQGTRNQADCPHPDYPIRCRDKKWCVTPATHEGVDDENYFCSATARDIGTTFEAYRDEYKGLHEWFRKPITAIVVELLELIDMGAIPEVVGLELQEAARNVALAVQHMTEDELRDTPFLVAAQQVDMLAMNVANLRKIALLKDARASAEAVRDMTHQITKPVVKGAQVDQWTMIDKTLRSHDLEKEASRLAEATRRLALPEVVGSTVDPLELAQTQTRRVMMLDKAADTMKALSALTNSLTDSFEQEDQIDEERLIAEALEEVSLSQGVKRLQEEVDRIVNDYLLDPLDAYEFDAAPSKKRAQMITDTVDQPYISQLMKNGVQLEDVLQATVELRTASDKLYEDKTLNAGIAVATHLRDLAQLLRLRSIYEAPLGQIQPSLPGPLVETDVNRALGNLMLPFIEKERREGRFIPRQKTYITLQGISKDINDWTRWMVNRDRNAARPVRVAQAAGGRRRRRYQRRY